MPERVARIALTTLRVAIPYKSGINSNVIGKEYEVITETDVAIPYKSGINSNSKKQSTGKK